MVILPVLAAIGASFGWAAGIILAQKPAQLLGSFEFTRIQLISCSFLLAVIITAMGYWDTVAWNFWPSFALSIFIGIVLGNLTMVECLRRGGPRRTELLLSMKSPIVAVLAYFWYGEEPSMIDLIGAVIVLSGICIAITYGSNEKSNTDKLKGSLVSVLIFGIAAAGFQGFGFLIMKPAMLAGSEPLAVSTVRLLGAALLISFIMLWPAHIFKSGVDLTPKLLSQTIVPGVIGYGVSSTLLLYAFANFDAGIAAVLGSLSPVLVLPLIWMKDGVPIRWQAALGAILSVSGTGIIIIS